MRAFTHAIREFLASSIGKKILVALSGIVLVLFVAGHLAGNLLIYRDPSEINSYAHELRELLHGSFLWIARAVLLLTVVVHISCSVMLARENQVARKVKYRRRHFMDASLASRTMALSGLVILAFVIFHLLHFTVQVTDPEFKEMHYMLDGEKVHDVHAMVVKGFQDKWVSGFYILSMGLLCVHLSHGFASLFQTLGLRSSRTELVLKRIGIAYALVIFLGNISIPISILAKLGPFANT